MLTWTSREPFVRLPIQEGTVSVLRFMHTVPGLEPGIAEKRSADPLGGAACASFHAWKHASVIGLLTLSVIYRLAVSHSCPSTSLERRERGTPSLSFQQLSLLIEPPRSFVPPPQSTSFLRTTLVILPFFNSRTYAHLINTPFASFSPFSRRLIPGPIQSSAGPISTPTFLYPHSRARCFRASTDSSWGFAVVRSLRLVAFAVEDAPSWAKSVGWPLRLLLTLRLTIVSAIWRHLGRWIFRDPTTHIPMEGS